MGGGQVVVLKKKYTFHRALYAAMTCSPVTSPINIPPVDGGPPVYPSWNGPS